MNEWIYKNEIAQDSIFLGFIGFVYIIINKKTQMKYIGKKILKYNNNKNSGWKKYYGSNKQLLQEKCKIGEENFERTILYLCKSKSEMSYLEAKEQFLRDVLLKPNEYYNGWIMVKVCN